MIQDVRRGDLVRSEREVRAVRLWGPMKRVTLLADGASTSQGGSVGDVGSSSLMSVGVRSVVVDAGGVGAGAVRGFAVVDVEVVLAAFVDAPFVVGVFVDCVAGRC